MYDSTFCVATKAMTNENLNTVKNSDWASDLVSAFHSAGELLAISSKQHTIGINKSIKLSKASCRSIQQVQHISFIFLRFSLANRLSIHFSKANCHFGELIKNRDTSSADCIILLISLIVQDLTTHRFSLWKHSECTML